MSMSAFRCAVLSAVALAAVPVIAADDTQATFELRAMTPETALKAARAALEHCRGQGFQVAVAVVDRSGLLQVLLRDRFAGAHTVGVATDKAWTSASFRLSTLELVAATAANPGLVGIRQVPRVLAVGGGLPVDAAGSLVGAIGVSGAPGGEADDECARAGLDAVADDLAF